MRVGWLCCVIALVVGGCTSMSGDAPVARDVPEIKLESGVYEIASADTAFDTPVLSPDGQRLVVQVESYRDPMLPYEVYDLVVAEKGADDQWGELRTWLPGVYKPYGGEMEMPIQAAFDETSQWLVLTQIRFDSFLSMPSALSLRSWIERRPWSGGGEVKRLVEPADWDLPSDELVQHPRISPDGRWLTFYCRVHDAAQGVYLLNLQTEQHFRLSTEHDKHPTWSADGKRIYFHHVHAGKRHRFDMFTLSDEQSVIGYFDMTFHGRTHPDWRRVLMDQPGGDAFIYHKHPVEIPQTDLLAFHGRKSPDGDMKLMVRRDEPGSPVFEIEPYWQGEKLKEAKHPCSSFRYTDLVFVAKPKGEKRYHLLLGLDESALATVREVVEGGVVETARGSSRSATALGMN